MTVVGLTGNFGMGKSTVAKMFRQLGAMTIDTDGIVRALLDDPGTVYEIRKAFGDAVVKDGVVDREGPRRPGFQRAAPEDPDRRHHPSAGPY
ncbi:MAG: dephospho-CoA kinase [Desulfobacterales bacterium]|nr:dephospho-CoA kinase [Desulfobacterales bacterium]